MTDQKKAPSSGNREGAKNKFDTKNLSPEQLLEQSKRLTGDFVVFTYQDEGGNDRHGVLFDRYKKTVLAIHKEGSKGLTVKQATYDGPRLRYITQHIHDIRVKKGYGFDFITTEPVEVGGVKPIALYRLTPSFKVIAAGVR